LFREGVGVCDDAEGGLLCSGGHSISFREGPLGILNALCIMHCQCIYAFRIIVIEC
jgi:hypothetical protein